MTRKKRIQNNYKHPHSVSKANDFHVSTKNSPKINHFKPAGVKQKGVFVKKEGELDAMQKDAMRLAAIKLPDDIEKRRQMIVSMMPEEKDTYLESKALSSLIRRFRRLIVYGD